jgi:lycopene beta-cyclase
MRDAGFLIVGGGLAGALCAAALKRLNGGVPLMLVEQGDRFGGNHRWSYFDSDLDAAGHSLLEGIRKHQWPRHEVRFPGRRRTLQTGYRSFNSAALDAWVRENLEADEYRLGADVVSVAEGSVELASGEVLHAAQVLDARGPVAGAGIEAGWQKFVGLDLEVTGHNLTHPILMDACIDQTGGYRFFYVLPLGPDRLFVEDTYFNESPALDVPALRAGIRDYAGAYGAVGAELASEAGVLPIVMAGTPDLFWPPDDPVARLGMRGGFFHHATSYSLPVAVSTALAFAQAAATGQSPDAGWLRARFVQHWDQQGYYRLLNTLMLRAAGPEERVRIYEHFYRLPEALIERFYRGSLTWSDRLRIMSGKPPVPITSALAAILSGRAAA